MGRGRRVDALTCGLVAALAASIAASGCKKPRPPVEQEIPAPRPQPVAPDVPVDRALPGELAEGTDKAFTLTLPRVMKVRARFNDMLFGTAEVSPDLVANYVRQRVSAGKVETGPSKTVFSHAIVRGQPSVEMSIEVLSRGGSTELHVHNLSVVKPNDALRSEDERWRAAGLKPDGTPLDPTHLE